MPGTHVAFLRGINVGRAKRVAMADLKAMVEGLGYRDVRTVLNSGNVVFTVPSQAKGDPATRIERGMVERIKVPSRVTVLTAAELAAAVARNPLGKVAHDPSLTLVAVPRTAADRARVAGLARRDWAPEAFALGRRVAYLWCPGGSIKSALWAAVADVLEDDVTTRNWATMTRLSALASGS